MALTVNGVLICAGLISVTETGAPSSSSSIRRASVKPLIANLVAEYAPCSGTERSDTSLPRLMMAPPPDRLSCFAASREP